MAQLKSQTFKKVGDVFEEFLERLLTEKGITQMDSEVREQIKADLRESLERRINAALVRSLPQEKLDDFDKVLEQGKQGKIQSFLKKNIANMHDVIAQELLEFRKTYLTA